MDWSASNEVIETLESTINGVPVNNARGERDDDDGDGDGDGDEDDDYEEVPDIVEEVFSMVYEAGEKLYASLLNWAPWKSDPNLAPASSSDLASHLGRPGREIELSERDPSSVWGRSITEPGRSRMIDPSADREPAVHKTALRGRDQVLCEMSGRERSKIVHSSIPRRCDSVPCEAPLIRAQCPAEGAGIQKHPKCPL